MDSFTQYPINSNTTKCNNSYAEFHNQKQCECEFEADKCDDCSSLSYAEFQNQKKSLQCKPPKPNTNACSISYSQFLNPKECLQCESHKCDKSLLFYQEEMSSCEAHLFCDTTSRLSFELCVANNLCEVQQIVDTISCLFSASALKQNALAEVIKASNIKCIKHYGCCCK